MGKLLCLQHGQTFNVGNSGEMTSRTLTLEPKDGGVAFTVGPFYAMQGEPDPASQLSSQEPTADLWVDSKAKAGFRLADLPKLDHVFDLAPEGARRNHSEPARLAS